jgi:hypothetical protein
MMRKVLCVVALSMMASCFIGDPGFFENEPAEVVKNTYVSYADDSGWAQVKIPNHDPDSFVDVVVWRALQNGADGPDYQYVFVSDVHLWPDGTVGAQSYPRAKILFVVSTR